MDEKRSWHVRLGEWWEHNWWVFLVLLGVSALGCLLGYYWAIPYLE